MGSYTASVAPTIDTSSDGRRTARAAIALFALIALAAVAGVVLLVAQERSRMRISAEYRAFQLAADLLRVVDSGDFSTIAKTEGLRAFAVYTRRGETVFRYGDAPASAHFPDSLEPARFESGQVSFLRLVGAAPDAEALRQRRASPMSGAPMGPGQGQGMMSSSRLVYVSIDTASLRAGEFILFALAALMLAAIAAAFFLLLSLAKSLDAFREREARNRELLALGDAARTLAHEIKNPLGVVKIQVALLRKIAGEAALNGLRVIEEETDRLSLLASRVKAFLSADDGTPRDIPAAETLASYAERYGERLAVEVDPSAAESLVRIDPLRLGQILDNLVSNAFDSLEGRDFKPPLLSAASRRGHVHFELSDRGSGIAEEHRMRVFDLFFTTKPSGAGIGLALARRYAEAAGGKLSCTPNPGGGTVFTLELPE